MMNKLPRDLKFLSRLLDQQFQGPFKTRFGLDGIIGLIPLWGDTVTAVISCYIIVRSAMLKAPAIILFQMAVNIVVDFLFGVVPVIGDIFDLYWKSNTKNVKLLNKYLDSPSRTFRRSKLAAYSVATLLVLLIISLIFIIMTLLSKLISS